MKEGILLIHKQVGMTSRDVVNELTHILHTKKIGHTGTLDPLASGILVVTVGRYTKLCSSLTSTYKEYIATMKLGIETDTLDITGNVLKEEKVSIEKEKIEEVILSYQKKYIQEVPLYSAVKVNGKRLYEYARNGEKVSLPKKEVNIKDIEIVEIKEDVIKFRCMVSKGTYIRSLIRDIGKSLGICATMLSLIRTQQGSFSLDDAYTLKDIEKNQYKFLTFEDVLDIEVLENYEKIFQVYNGVKQSIPCTKEFILFKDKGKEVALYKKEDEVYKMFIKL